MYPRRGTRVHPSALQPPEDPGQTGSSRWGIRYTPTTRAFSNTPPTSGTLFAMTRAASILSTYVTTR